MKKEENQNRQLLIERVKFSNSPILNNKIKKCLIDAKFKTLGDIVDAGKENVEKTCSISANCFTSIEKTLKIYGIELSKKAANVNIFSKNKLEKDLKEKGIDVLKSYDSSLFTVGSKSLELISNCIFKYVTNESLKKDNSSCTTIEEADKLYSLMTKFEKIVFEKQKSITSKSSKKTNLKTLVLSDDEMFME